METPSSNPSLLNPRLRLLLQTPSPNRAQESHDMDFMPVAGPSSTHSLFVVVDDDDKNRPIPRMPVNVISSPPSDSYGPGLQLGSSTSSAISSDTPAARLRALLTHSSDPPSRISRPRRNNFSMSETDVTPVVVSAREWHKGKRNSLDDDEDDRPISPPSSLPSSLLKQRGSLPIQFRALVSTSAASFHSAPDSPLKSSESEGDEQTMPPSSTPGTPPLASSASQDGPKAETHEADVTTVRVDEDSPANPKCTAMKTPRPPGAWTVTPVPLKHAPRVTPPPPASSPELTPTASSSWTPLSRANSEPKRRSKPEGPAGNSLLTPIHSLSRTKYLHVRTPAPPGAWMSTPNQSTTQNGSNVQSKFGSIRTKKSILKVRFDVTESEASTAEVEHQVSPLTTMRMFAPDSLPDGHASQVGNVPQTRINGSSQGDAINDPVSARPVTPERYMTPASHAAALSSRSLRKTLRVKVVDAFGRGSIDELPIPIANGRANAGDAIHASPSTRTRTHGASSKNQILIVDAMGREIQEDVPKPSFEEDSSALHDNPPICRTEALAQTRRTLREWAGRLNEEDSPPDNLALNPSHSKELEERSRAARHSRNQLARTLRIESVKERERDLMYKYTKCAENRSRLLPTISGENGPFHRDLVWFGVLLQIVFVLVMWRFAHAQARHLFCTVYYDPLYPKLNSRIGERAWEMWAERPNAETWPPT